MNLEAPSTLLTATMANVQAYVEAARHTKDCDYCPLALDSFLDAPTSKRCFRGNQLLRVIRRTELEVKQAVRSPMKRERFS